MPQRFDYDHLNRRVFELKLRKLEMTPDTFARLFGVRSRTVARWLDGEQDIPPWVIPVLALLELPKALGTVRTAAAGMIRRDNLRPEVAYPYVESRKEVAQ